MDFYEHLLYNRTLDLIQDFKNIKQNYYKSRGHFSSIPYRNLPVAKMIPCYCLGLTLQTFFLHLTGFTGLFILQWQMSRDKTSQESLWREQKPHDIKPMAEGGHEVVKAERAAVSLLLRAGPLQDVAVVVLLAGPQAEFAERGAALSLERALRCRHAGEGGQHRVGGRQVPGAGGLRAAVPAEPPLLLCLQAL